MHTYCFSLMALLSKQTLSQNNEKLFLKKETKYITFLFSHISLLVATIKTVKLTRAKENFNINQHWQTTFYAKL